MKTPCLYMLIKVTSHQSVKDLVCKKSLITNFFEIIVFTIENFTNCISYIPTFLAYKEYSGLCRNDNNQYSELGSFSIGPLLDCQRKCDETRNCGAVSWDGSNCWLTSSMASTSTSTSWRCYDKG